MGKGYHSTLLRETENERKRLKQKADKSHKEWINRQEEFEIMKLEIVELKKGLEDLRQQIEVCGIQINNFRQEYECAIGSTKEIKVSTL